MSSAWADEMDEEERPAPPPKMAWGQAPKANPKADSSVPVEPVGKPKPTKSNESDFPTLGSSGNAGARRSSSDVRNGSYKDERPRESDHYQAPAGREGYGREERHEGYSGRDGGRDGGYNRDGREGGYNRDGGREGGYNRDSGREGGYNRDSGREGGFNRDSGREGYNRDSGREGGYNRDGGREGGYNRDGGREGGYNRDGGQGRRDSAYGRDGGDRPQRPKIPIPNEPPFIAYVGNLDFSLTEDEIQNFFGCECEVRLVLFSDSQKPRGFAYVTFNDRSSLENALAKNGEELAGRSTKIDVSEGRKESSSSNTTWGRSGDREQHGDRNRDDRNRDDRNRDDRNRDDRNRDDRNREPPRESSKERERETPAERVPLKLKPPTRAASEEPALSQSGELKSSSGAPKSNPFGDAKPRDEVLYQKKIEERLREKEKEEKKPEEEGEKRDVEGEKRDVEGDKHGAEGEKRGVEGEKKLERESSGRGPQRGDDKRDVRRDDRRDERRDDRREGSRREFNKDNRDNRDNNRDNRGYRDDNNRDRDNRDSRDSRDNRDSRDVRDTRDNRDRDNRAPPTQSSTNAQKSPPVTSPPAAKDGPKKEDPKKAQPVKDKKKKDNAPSNQFALLNMGEEMP